jgi:N6-adenosine-specific RNA methylase IME4
VTASLIGLPLFHFGLVMADFPWRFDTWSDQGKKHKSPERHYKTMPLSEIRAMPIGHLGAKDCVYWIWGTHPMLPDQIGCLPFWGLQYVTSGVWVKRTRTGKLAFGTGYRLRSASEPFLIATNGKPDTAKNIRTVIEGPIREHSRKPDEAFAAAEQMVGGVPKLELFGRRSRAGWTVWGDEATKFDGVAA